MSGGERCGGLGVFASLLNHEVHEYMVSCGFGSIRVVCDIITTLI